MTPWVSETLYMRISAQNSVFTAPDGHMHTSLSYTSWAYNQQIRQWNIWSVHMSGKWYWSKLEKKTAAVNAYLIKKSKGAGGGGGDI